MTTLTFQNTNLSAINQNNQIWLTLTEIGRGLGYSDPFQSVKKIYDRHADEFTPCMTALIEIQTAGGMQKVRVFSLRGTHLIAMFARTKIAKAFRKWVLDILDSETTQPKKIALPEPEKKISFELTEKQWLRMASLWFALHNCLDVLDTVYKPLAALKSPYATTAYTHATEYQTSLGIAQRLLEPLFKGFDVDPIDEPHFHLALKTLRNYHPQGIGRLAKL